jgi:GH15 family glucan-1,4-alpha-glucosidase
MSAAELSLVLGKKEHATRYSSAAQEIQAGIMTHLWDEASGTFIKQISYEGGKMMRDTTLDVSSVYGVFSFGVLPIDDLRLTRAWEATTRRLSDGIAIGGIARYDGDNYFRADSNAAGNPWVITTLWYAEYLIARAHVESDFDRVRDILDWVVRYAPHSGVLPEQFNSQTGAPLSATPLAWSHAAYVSAVIAYLDKREKLGLCVDCDPAP